ncbi:hypothetical protein VNI00_005288 [Paramarasmius palmivorus]|uniref:Xylanolytic transcriptional activator regulatory domain-containing protein n=1 Tax=Paramarasmius palmivorus TaxID=297713 RepID=A0AAW0DBE5_9AGAR
MPPAQPRKFVFKQPTQQLRRGRRVYVAGFIRLNVTASDLTSALEQNIEQLQARIRELEGSSSKSTSPQPSELEALDGALYPEAISSEPIEFLFHTSPRSTADLTLDFGDSFNLVASESYTTASLVDTFLSHSCRLGFFLNTERFRSSVFLSLPFGDSSRPAEALLNTVYLWGARLSRTSSVHQQHMFLQRAISQISADLSSTMDYSNVLHIIQAELLLTTYFFHTNRFMEAEMHLNGAVSLCLSCGLHKIRSCRPSYSPVLGVFSGKEVHLRPAKDPVEEGERINGFWTVFYLHRLLTVMLGTASASFGTLDNPELQIDTPWPMDMDHYEGGQDIVFTSYRTIDNFLAMNCYEQDQNSAIALHVKSVILIHKAFCLHRKFKHGLKANELDSFTSECSSLDLVVTHFRSTIPFGDELQSRMNTVHALSSCAYMKLQTIFSHYGVAESQHKAVHLANSIIHIIRDSYSLDSSYGDSTLTIACIAACQTLAEEQESIRASPANPYPLDGYSKVHPGSYQDDRDWEQLVGSALSSGLETMMMMTEGCSLAGEFKPSLDAFPT